jgi:CRP/FNR family transcriptional regulator
MINESFPALRSIEATIRRETQVTTLEAGAFVCMDGNVCRSLALVVKGEVRVYKTGAGGREITLYRVRPGESCILTASCILSDRQFPAFAVADTDVTARIVPASSVRRWMDTEPVWRRYMFDLIAGRLDTVISTVEEVAFRRLDMRLAGLLLNMSVPLEGSRTHRVLHTTHERLAADLGSAREVVSRLLKDFENDGFVDLQRGTIRLLDLQGLQEKSRSDHAS